MVQPDRAARNRVPTFLPVDHVALSHSGRDAFAITIRTPEFTAIFAASILLRIPPLPQSRCVPPASASISGVISGDLLDQLAARRLTAGIAVVEPVHIREVQQQIGVHARRDERRQRVVLPNRISSVATVSFSFTIGRQPNRSSVYSVLRAFR